MPHLRSAALGSALVLAWLAAASPIARAGLQPASLRFASDITADLSGTTLTPAEVGEDDLAGMVTAVDVGTLPPDLHIDAYHQLANGDQLLSFDTTVELPGGDVADPADVVRFIGATYVIVFDASERGIPDGVNVDAVAVLDDNLLVSFDVAVRFGDTTFEDEDLVLATGMVPAFVEFFTGAGAGVPEDLDLDGAHVLGATRILISFDGSGVLDGIAFDDDDVLEYDGDGGWTLVYEGAAQHAGWQDADLAALSAPASAPSPTPTPTSEVTGVATHTTTATAPASSTPTLTGAATATPTRTGGATPTATATSVTVATATATRSATIDCVGDCDGDGDVNINELIIIVNIALGNLPLDDCPAGDPDGNGDIAINEIIQAVNSALNGC